MPAGLNPLFDFFWQFFRDPVVWTDNQHIVMKGLVSLTMVAMKTGKKLSELS